ncbi:DUF3761 domain-containing protein [Actinomadura oligospora]|uniref:DUF3761 domain-containing protein n=1 Tax=Actinomadura oligospora TaxID=111804 RepID=UPI0004AD63A3|nr:DUF3761 domain-containing protein [Actinomadura oligospora]
MRKSLTGVLLSAVLLTGCNAVPEPKAAVIPTNSPSATSPTGSPSRTVTTTPPRKRPSSPPTPRPSTSPVHRPKPSTPSPQRPSAKPKTPRFPSGATAICRDGTFSFSQHRRGTCSHHGGVARWL